MKIIRRERSDYLSNTDIWYVRSPEMDREYRIMVTAPEGTWPSETRFPSFYMTDGDCTAGALPGAARLMSVAGGLPKMFTISIGYPTDISPCGQIQRTRDLTPSHCPSYDMFLPTVMGEKEIIASGGAEAFHRFIVDDLKPELEQFYPLDTHDAGLGGHSLGGLFVLFSICVRPGAFQKYLAASPSVWWDQKIILKLAAKAVAAYPSPAASLYLCSGELETSEKVQENFAKMPDNLKKILPQDLMSTAIGQAGNKEIMKVLEPWTKGSLTMKEALHPAETHESMLGSAISRGLRTLYGTL